MKTLLTAVALATVGLGATAAVAREPVQNVSSFWHGNLANAQDLSRQAYDALTAAQNVNSNDLGGHAARAKDLLRQANIEIKLAAEAANNR